MKIVITGSSGFIGSHLKERLYKDHEVVGLNRTFLYNTLASALFFKSWKPDHIIHCAAYGNMAHQTDDTETLTANISALSTLLAASKDMPLKGFINFSSSSVTLPYETMYSATKASGERIVKAWVNKYDKPIVNVRPYTVIGKGEQEEHLIPTIIKSCLHGNKMQLVTDPVHDYIGIDDLCNAIVLIMENAEKLKGKTIDIGTGTMTSNKEVLQIVEKLTGKKANVETIEGLRLYDTNKWKANPSKLKNLGWKQTQTVKDIIKTMI